MTVATQAKERYEAALEIIRSCEDSKQAKQKMRDRGLSWNTFKKDMKRHTGNMAYAHLIGQDLKGESSSTDEHIKPDFAERPSKVVDVLAELKLMVSEVDRHGGFSSDYEQININTTHPVAVIKAADIHFGGLDVDYKAFLAHVEMLLDTPHFYLQLFGDDLNMMVMHRNTAARHDVRTPNEQIAWLESFVDLLVEKGKLISMCWGNHTDEFTEKNAGYGITKVMARHKIPYFSAIGYIDLVVGEQVYPIGFTHASRFNSFMRPAHGSKRMQQMHREFFGINKPLCREYITAHTHAPSYECEGCLPDDRCWLVKCGTFKVNDVYSRRYFGRGRIGCPTCVYFPDKLEHVYFPTPFEAYRYMYGTDYHVKSD